MNAAQHLEKFPGRKRKVCIGVALAARGVRVTARVDGRAWPRAGRWRGTRPGSVSRDSANGLRRTRFGTLRGTGHLTAGADSLATHICPVCGKRYEVHTVLHQFAYGRQLTCSCRCKAAHRRNTLANHLHGVERAKRGMALAECDEAGCYASAAGRLGA
jgi:hypothetical protein